MSGRARVALTCAVWAVLLAGPLWLSEWRLTQLGQLMCYGILAMSLAFVWGQVGLLCFGHAIFFGVGAYSMALLTKGMVTGLPSASWTGLGAAVLLPGVFAWVAGQLMFRGRGLSGAYFAIVTLAAAAIAERIASHWGYIGGFNGLMDVPPLRASFFGAARDIVDPFAVYYLLLGAAAGVFVLCLWLERAPLGTALRAIRDDPERTQYLGFDLAMLKTTAFAISGAIAGLAGALFASQFGFVSPALAGTALSTEVLIWVGLGGREVLLAAFLGAIIVRATESVLSERLGAYWLLALGVLFMIVVIVFPGGLAGRWLSLPLPARMRQQSTDTGVRAASPQ